MIIIIMIWSRESSVNIATGYGLNGWGSIPGKGKSFLYIVEGRVELPIFTLVSCLAYSSALKMEG
jgi:hypothetical protein